MNAHIAYLLLTNFIDMIIMITFFNTFLIHYKYLRKHMILLYFTAVAFLSTIDQLMIPILNIATHIIITVLFSFLYDTPRNFRFIIIFSYLSIGIITEPIGIQILQLMQIRQNSISLQGAISLIRVLIRFIIVLVLCKIKRFKEKSVSNRITLIFIFAFFLHIIICVLLANISVSLDDNKSIIIVFIITFSLLISIFLLFTLIEEITALQKADFENIAYKQEYEFQKKCYEEIDHQIIQLHKIKHDYKNELLTLYDLFLKDSSSVLNILCNYITNLDNVSFDTYSSNKCLNSILRIKYTLAKKMSIKITSSAFIPQELDLKYSEIGIIFGNLLDNAIEANMQLSEKHRYIILKTQYLDDFLFVHIKNPYDSSITSPKMPIEEHGYGLKNVKQIVEQHNGVIKFNTSNNVFEVDIILYNMKVHK